MSPIGWLLCLLAGAAGAGACWWLWNARAPRRLRYLQPYRPGQEREEG